VLDKTSRELLASRVTGSDRVEAGGYLVLIVADGLSALAVERHAVSLLVELLPQLGGWSIGPIVVVEQGRVAIGDEIGMALSAQISVVLIGERPGLSSPDSLGAYITWDPRPGRNDAERNCISNIRAEGLSYQQAAGQLRSYLTEARRLQQTGVELKLDSGVERLMGK
jgi:ethanolamine ammonia-lyase small subunit